ncbi:hypothetical protein ACVXG9_20320 [Escherichia coli]
MMTPQNARIWYISPKEPHNKTAYLSMRRIRSIKSANKLSLTGSKKLQYCASLPELNPYS